MMVIPVLFIIYGKWDKDETLLEITSVKSGKVEKYIVVSVSDKELVLKDETGIQQLIRAV